MFYNYQAMQKVVQSLYIIEKQIIGKNENNINQITEVLQQGYLPLIDQSSFELHFVPTSDPKF